MTLEEKIIKLHHETIVNEMLIHRSDPSNYRFQWSDKSRKKTPIADLETSHIKNILIAIRRSSGEGLWNQHYKKKYLENELLLREMEAQDGTKN